MAARTVYGVYPMDDTHTGTGYFSRKADAMSAARAIAKDGSEATVTADVVARSLGGARLFTALLNHEGWSESSVELVVIPAGKVEIL